MEQEKESGRGSWRVDIIIMILYQITLVFAAQLIFVIFLDYMPPTYCTEDYFCYKLNSMCLTDYDRHGKNLCPETMGENRRSCIIDKKQLLFQSAQLYYQHDCTGLKAFDLSTATFIGTLLGNIILGFLADKHGRRLIYFLSVLFGIPCLVFSAAINNIFVFYIFRVLVGFSVAGTLTVGWTYATEMIHPNKRLRLLAIANWPNARMIQVFFAFMSKEWTRTTYITASLSCLALPILWYLPESPIWLEQKDKFEEASRARKRIIKINGGSDDRLDPIQITSLKKVTPMRILKTGKLRTSFIVILFIYFYVGMAVYITDLNGADMTRNLYLGQFLSGLVLSIAQFIIGMSEPCLTGMGRRVLFLASQTVALICYAVIVACLYSNAKGTWVYLSAYTLAYASQSICLESAYLALVELMPTGVRATVGSIANIAMKIGTIVATQTKHLKFTYEPALFFINLALGVVGMIVVFFFLEESRSADLRLVGQNGTLFAEDGVDHQREVDLESLPEPTVTLTTPTTPTSPMTPTIPTLLTPTTVEQEKKEEEVVGAKISKTPAPLPSKETSKETAKEAPIEKSKETTSAEPVEKEPTINVKTAQEPITMDRTQAKTTKDAETTGYEKRSTATMKTFRPIGKTRSRDQPVSMKTNSTYDNEDD